jgi:hypothetical protein
MAMRQKLEQMKHGLEVAALGRLENPQIADLAEKTY